MQVYQNKFPNIVSLAHFLAWGNHSHFTYILASFKNNHMVYISYRRLLIVTGWIEDQMNLIQLGIIF